MARQLRRFDQTEMSEAILSLSRNPDQAKSARSLTSETPQQHHATQPSAANET